MAGSGSAGERAGVSVIRHPLIQNALAVLRSVDTPTESFRRHARLLTMILAFHVLEDLPVRVVAVQTPLEQVPGEVIDANVIFIPVLRAGLAMLDAMSDMVPGSKVGFVGLERNEETFIARSYYQKLPAHLADAEVVILDPMLATGGSAIATIELLKAQSATSLRLACVIAAPEGIANLTQKHSDVPIFAATVDRELNSRKYILPGIGDFGDRYFGTE